MGKKKQGSRGQKKNQRRPASKGATVVRLAKRNRAIFPVHWVRDGMCSCGKRSCSNPGKHPIASLAPNGIHAATTDPDQIAVWWAQKPRANVGVATGSISGIFVLDVDAKHGGHESLRALEQELGVTFDTVTVESGGGGRHFWFALPEGTTIKSSSGKLGPGLDIRGEGGSIIAPPSMHASGKRYRWVEGKSPFERDPADPPPALIERIVEHAKPRPAVRVSTTGGLTEGERNSGLTQFAGKLRAEGLSEAVIEAALIEENVKRCDPPLGDEEVRQIAASVGRYEQGELIMAPKLREVPPWDPFPTEALPAPLTGFIESGAGALGCDPSFLALPVLSALAAAIGNTRVVQLKASWTEPAVVWTAIIGDSGTLKSPAIEVALGPLHEEEQRLYLNYLADLEAHRSDPEHIPRPTRKRRVCADVTIEALAAILAVCHRGILGARDELSGWFGGFNRYRGGSGGEEAQRLELHRAGVLSVDRKTGDIPSIFVRRASVSITGGIQPAILRRTLTDDQRDSGLLARLLLAWPPKRAKKWTDQAIPPTQLIKFERILRRLYSLQPRGLTECGYEPSELTLNPGARDLWVAFYNEFADEQFHLAGDLSASWAKIEGYAARFALLFELAKWAGSRASAKAVPHEISAESMDAAIRLAHWFAAEQRRIYALFRDSEEAAADRRTLELIERQGGQITARELARANAEFASTNEAQQKLDSFVARGQGKWVNRKPGPQGGRPTREFVLAEHEKPRRVRKKRASKTAARKKATKKIRVKKAKPKKRGSRKEASS